MARYEANIDKIKEAIEILGGMVSLSKAIKISYQSVLDWKSGRRSLSPESCIKIEKATEGKVNRREILPDYPWD
jgi:DNA-binding transcriptional regulator YdaS (Cro superfamily)